MAMLKQFAPIAVIPPSPKKTAWMTSAIEMAAIEAHGPSTMLATPMPTAWPVVPPGSGRLNIMITKENAENTEISGTIREWRVALSRRSATYQNGVEAAYSPAQVDGLR